MDLHARKRNIFITEIKRLAYTQAGGIHQGDNALIFIAGHGIDDLFHFRFCRNGGDIFIITEERDLETVPVTVQGVPEEKDQLGDVRVNGAVIQFPYIFQMADIRAYFFPGNILRAFSAKRLINKVEELVQIGSIVADRAFREIPQGQHICKFGDIAFSVKHGDPPQMI